jgi:hypothetical protein
MGGTVRGPLSSCPATDVVSQRTPCLHRACCSFDRSCGARLRRAAPNQENRSDPRGGHQHRSSDHDRGWDSLDRGMLSQRASILGRRLADGAPERAGEARLRGKPAIKSNLIERRAPHRDHGFGVFQPPLADVAAWRHARGGGKCTGEMKDAETCDIGQVGDGDLFREMLFNVGENAPQSSVIQPMSRRRRQPDETGLAVRVRQPCRVACSQSRQPWLPFALLLLAQLAFTPDLVV